MVLWRAINANTKERSLCSSFNSEESEPLSVVGDDSPDLA